MKLRNKKTGEIVEREEFILIKHIEGDGGWQDGSYHSLAELNENWEDYEPLVKDENSREIIKKWYNKNNIIGKLRSYGSAGWLGLRGEDKCECSWKIELHVDYISTLEYDELYSLTELIGEEENEAKE